MPELPRLRAPRCFLQNSQVPCRPSEAPRHSLVNTSGASFRPFHFSISYTSPTPLLSPSDKDTSRYCFLLVFRAPISVRIAFILARLSQYKSLAVIMVKAGMVNAPQPRIPERLPQNQDCDVRQPINTDRCFLIVVAGASGGIGQVSCSGSQITGSRTYRQHQTLIDLLRVLFSPCLCFSRLALSLMSWLFTMSSTPPALLPISPISLHVR